jgi:hypothetical protein
MKYAGEMGSGTMIYISFFSGSSNPFRASASYSVPYSFFTDGRLLGRVIRSSQGRYLNGGQYKHSLNAYTQQASML